MYFRSTKPIAMKKALATALCFLIVSLGTAQDRKQTVRGRVSDKETNMPLPFASVALFVDSALKFGTTSDTGGYFRIENVPVGRYVLKARLVGYLPASLGDIIVSSGKETIVNVEIEESATQIQSVEIRGAIKAETINDMAMGSMRMFSIDETNRFAGSRSDPGRMARNFAGVQGSDDSRNDIVIRGNSPLGVLWRINGIDVPNPNHFAVPGTTGGGVSMINNKVIDNSDFLTGAFPAEFGNSVAGVFDLKFRNGNNEKHEYSAQLGFLGTELAAEGPLSKEKKSSFLLAYRYSTLKLFESFHIKVGTEAIPNYQDLSFKFTFPKNNFSIFGLGGTSRINILVSSYIKPSEEIYGENNQDQDFRTSLGMIGVSKMFVFDNSAYIKIIVGYQKSKAFAADDNVYRNVDFGIDSITPAIRYTFLTGRLSGNLSYNKKFNAASSIKAGVDVVRMDFDLKDSTYNTVFYQFIKRLDFIGSTWLFQPYVQYKHKFSDRVVLNAGLHGQYLYLNNSTSIEPRLGLKWNLKDNQSLNFAVGLHSQMQPYYIYYHLQKDNAGNISMQNHDLSFSRSIHYIIGYDYSFKQNARIKIETYYMHLFDVPVTVTSSSYTILNEGAVFSRFFPSKLVNEGTGKNYGVEFTYEKFFSKTYFLLFTSSLYESKYKGSDGIERNTSFNGQYASNLLAGKEFPVGKHKNTTLSTGLKLTYAGGLRYTPGDTAASRLAGELVEVDSLRNTKQFNDYFRLDLKLGVKINAKKITHELAFDFVNLLNTKNILKLTYFYDPSHPNDNPVKETYQLGFLPLFYYKVDF
jgi:hypothetical protein